MDELFIDDGYTRQTTIAAVAGLHPEVTAVYRPAIGRERINYAAKLATKDPEQVERFELDLLVRHVKSLDGRPTDQWRGRVAQIVPAVRSQLLDLILGYTPAQQAADQKNSHSA